MQKFKEGWYKPNQVKQSCHVKEMLMYEDGNLGITMLNVLSHLIVL